MTETDHSDSNTSEIVRQNINRLKYLCAIIPPLLEKISSKDFLYKPKPEKWSKQEILGHLLDSATNNHHRFIRSQIEDSPSIKYNQDEWNDCSRYNEMDRSHLIDFWKTYNRYIIFIINAMSPDALKRKCRTNEPEPVSIEWLFEDYVSHLEHHLRQLVEYD